MGEKKAIAEWEEDGKIEVALGQRYQATLSGNL